MLLERMVVREGRRVVLFAPKAAREDVWERAIQRYLPHLNSGFVNFVLYNHTDLQRKGHWRRDIELTLRDADVVLIDEAHHFRNPGIKGEGEKEAFPLPAVAAIPAIQRAPEATLSAHRHTRQQFDPRFPPHDRTGGQRDRVCLTTRHPQPARPLQPARKAPARQGYRIPTNSNWNSVSKFLRPSKHCAPTAFSMQSSFSAVVVTSRKASASRTPAKPSSRNAKHLTSLPTT